MNNSRIRLWILAGLILFCGAAQANDAFDARTFIVKYNESDVITPGGATALYARLRLAARQVCLPFEGRELQLHKGWRSCYDRALGDAVARVNRDTVTALHRRASQSERAS
jgi:UrcA family protein